jgi:hypothetical protein
MQASSSSAQHARQVLADRLRELRVGAGLTARELARAARRRGGGGGDPDCPPAGTAARWPHGRFLLEVTKTTLSSQWSQLLNRRIFAGPVRRVPGDAVPGRTTSIRSPGSRISTGWPVCRMTPHTPRARWLKGQPCQPSGPIITGASHERDVRWRGAAAEMKMRPKRSFQTVGDLGNLRT